MANTVTQQTLVGSAADRLIVRKINLISDGTQESNTVIFDTASFTGTLSKQKIMYVYISGDGGCVRLNWDASSQKVALSLNSAYDAYLDFSQFGGLVNNGGSGVTGKITMTTTGLASGNELTLIFCVAQG